MENLIALVVATTILVMIPGPNVALIVANSLRYGARFGLVTVIGTTIGVGFQLGLVVFGLSAMIDAAANVLVWLKWAGVSYLIYLGIRAWNDPASDLSQTDAQGERAGPLFWRGLGLALVNPKTLIFNAAFLPQFVNGGPDASSQLALIAAMFLVVLSLGDALWALGASKARQFIARFGRVRNRLTGGLLISAGIGLALSRR